MSQVNIHTRPMTPTHAAQAFLLAAIAAGVMIPAINKETS